MFIWFVLVLLGYLLLYTADHATDDHHWAVEGVLGEKLSMTITDLTADTTYYFKVQARNSKGYGPMSPMTIYKTPKSMFISFQPFFSVNDSKYNISYATVYQVSKSVHLSVCLLTTQPWII